MKNIEKWIIIIFSVITVAAIGTAVYFGVNSTNIKEDNNKVIETNKEDVKNPINNNEETLSKEEQDDNKEAIAFCEANKDKIYNKIIENRNNSLAAKYDKKLLDSLHDLSSKDDLNCNYAANNNSYYKYILYFESIDDTLSDYVVFDEDLMLHEYVTTIEDDYKINESFAISLSYEIISNDLSESDDMYYLFVLNIYNQDKVLLEKVNFDVDEGSVADTNLLELYLVDLKTKTYEKLK